MGLHKFSTSGSNTVKFTEDEERIFDEFKEKCREKGIDHRSLVKKINYLYKLR